MMLFENEICFVFVMCNDIDSSNKTSVFLEKLFEKSIKLSINE